MQLIKKHAALLRIAAAVIVLLGSLSFLVLRFEVVSRLAVRLDGNSARIPILMYHHFADDDSSPGTVISAEMFESHIKALSDAGYTAISFEELFDYVYHGASLPERPLVITIDDGYMSVFETAYPILRKYDMKATVFIIGVLHGETLYKDTQYPVYPLHFGDAEALKMVESGTISIQSHSFDMHQNEPYETGPFRKGVLRMSGEGKEDYIEAFNADFERAASQIENMVGVRPSVYSYPYGRHSKLSEKLLRDNGVKATVTIRKGISIVKRDSPESLFGLKRYNVRGDMTAEKLLALIR